MNQKTAKLVRFYVGFRKSQGKPISLKDFKRRYRMSPWNIRRYIRNAMAEYLDHYQPEDRRKLRASKPHWGKVESGPRGGVMAAIAALFGFTAKR